MGENNYELNLKTLKEMILDEQKIVTYITLSKELCVHVNEAKLLLKKALEDIKTLQPGTELNVNYIVSGLSDSDMGQTMVCSETDLNHIKRTFKNIFFLHIYSLSKGMSSLDKVSLLATNKLEDFPLCIGIIKNDSCSKRKLDDRAFKLDCPVATHDSNTITPQLNNINKSKVNNLLKKQGPLNRHDDDKNNKMDVSISEAKVKKEVFSPKKSSTGNQLLNRNAGSGSKSIAGFFNKVSNLSNTQLKNEREKIIKEKPIKKEIELKEEKMDIDNIIPSENEKIVQSKSDLVKKAVSNIKKNAKVDKKRKRLLHISDSESDSERNDSLLNTKTENCESEDEIPPTPDNCIKITSGIVNPKKRRKIVDKTYVDDEGYILTHKEEVYESCSENEEENSKKENVNNKQPIKIEISPDNKSPKEKKTKNKKKSLSPQKGKQLTMMTFFKKI